MSNRTNQPPSRPFSEPDRIVQIPYHIADMVAGEVSRAHLALTAINQLLRSGSIGGEEPCLGQLLGYIEDGLERCDSELFNCLPRA